MARDEHDREDLLAEATALVERVELRHSRGAEQVVAGFRRDGALSIYFGADPVYHFDVLGRLRRAYRAGRLFKADGGRLAALDRRRETGQTILLRHDLDEAEQAAFLSELRNRLRTLQSAVRAGLIETVRQVPQDADVVRRLSAWLDQFASATRIAAHAGRARSTDWN
jgi:hypothetical protein